MRPARSPPALLPPAVLLAVLAAAAIAVPPALGQDPGQDPGTISPTAVGSLRDDRGAFDRLGAPSDIEVFAISNRTYALAASALGTQILDITYPGSPLPVAVIGGDRDGQPYLGGHGRAGVFASSGHTYALVSGPNMIMIINITTPDNPQTVTTIRSGQDNFYALRHLSPERTEEILAGHPGARDLSYSWEQISDIETLATPSNRTYALLSSVDTDTVQIVEVTDPRIPLLVASVSDGLEGFYALAHPQDIEALALSNRTYALVASSRDNALQVIDITDPSSPTPISSIREGQHGLGRMSGPADLEAFAVDGGAYAMVSGFGGRTAQIIDITDPSSPTPAASIREHQDGFAAAGRPEATFTSSGRTYALLAHPDILQIIDVTDPSSPTPAASIPGYEGGGSEYYTSYFEEVEVFAASGRTYALASGSAEALLVINITDPSSPQRLATITGGLLIPPHAGGGPAEAETFTLSGRTYALLAGSGDEALLVINITDPGSPQRLATIPDGQDGFGGLDSPADMVTLAVSGRMYALVADDHYGTILVINVTDPAEPVPVTGIWDGSGSIGTFNTSNKTYALVVSESTIQVINVTDPADPSTISGTRAPDSFHFGPGGPGGLGIFTESGRTYAMAPPTYNQEIQIINITDVLAPDLLDPVEIDSFRFLPVFTDSLDMEIFSGHGRTYALVSGSSHFDPTGTLQIIDITRPQNPVLLATILGGQDGFEALRMPVDVEAFTADGRAYALVVDYGSGSGGSIQVIDITDPGDPLPVTTLAGGRDGFDAMDNPIDIETFSIGGVTYALVSNPGGSVLQLISLSSQAAP